LRATIVAAIITTPRHRLAIQIVARFPSRLSRYSQRMTVSGFTIVGSNAMTSATSLEAALKVPLRSPGLLVH
jgi:hypothetical protein